VIWNSVKHDGTIYILLVITTLYDARYNHDCSQTIFLQPDTSSTPAKLLLLEQATFYWRKWEGEDFSGVMILLRRV